VLLHNPDDLLFRKPALLHPSPLLHITRELQFSLAEFFGGRSGPAVSSHLKPEIKLGWIRTD
jgi:hypothetical protein